MKGQPQIFTSESVSEGHPDKIADRISDTILDAILSGDPEARVACETLVKTGLVIIAGEIRTDVYVDVETLVRDAVRDIGYTDSHMGFDADGCAVLNAIGQQSKDIAIGVDESHAHEQGAGDQGLMFGFANRDTDAFMPAPIYYAHKLVEHYAKLRREVHDWMRPDAKSQVTLRYQDGVPVGLDAVVLSMHHSEDVDNATIESVAREEIIATVFPKEWISKETRFHINPTGRFVVGGPKGDCGLTGRKIIVDTYGGYARHGGGAFSGKDPSKVDRSAAYACRYVAKNIVAAGLADVCEIQVSYAIGVAEPTSISVDAFGTEKIPVEKISALIREHFDLRPGGLIAMLDLKRPIYVPTSAYGHFGREGFPWEATDKVDVLRAAL